MMREHYSSTAPHRLDTLPDDVLGPIFKKLTIQDLLKCRQAGKLMRSRVDSLGIPLYLITHRQYHRTLSPPPSQWPPFLLAKHNYRINKSLESHTWHALQMGRTWRQSAIPTIYVDEDKGRIVIGAGGEVIVHSLYAPRGYYGEPRYGGKVVGPGRGFVLRTPGSGSKSDVVSIVDLHDGQGSFAIAKFDGQIERVILPDYGPTIPKSTARYPHESTRSTRLRKVTGSEKGELMMTTSWDGVVSLLHTRSPWIEPTAMSLEGKVAWSSLLITSHPTLSPTAMLGTKTAISIHSILPSGISPTPSRLLQGPEYPQTSSPYDLRLPSPSSSHHPSLLLSAWYDSHLRIHDLRSPSLSPILTFQDPFTWADDSAFYSTCFTGEHYIAGGGARHGTVAFFDIRNSKTGWSCFSPGGKGSPVYSLQGEGGRVWGVTERRAFVLAFDGSGDEPGGLVAHEARAMALRDRDRGRHVPSGWRGRGGKWAWTAKYDTDEGNRAVGYEHTERDIRLFDSLIAA